MVEPAPPAGPSAARLAEYRRKLEEFEALGLDTAPLQRVLEESPDEFEREAEAFLRRELTGEEPPAEEAVAPEPAEEAVAPEPAEEAVAPEPAEEAGTPEPAEEAGTPEPAEEAGTPEPAEEAVAPEPGAEPAAAPAAPGTTGGRAEEQVGAQAAEVPEASLEKAADAEAGPEGGEVPEDRETAGSQEGVEVPPETPGAEPAAKDGAVEPAATGGTEAPPEAEDGAAEAGAGEPAKEPAAEREVHAPETAPTIPPVPAQAEPARDAIEEAMQEEVEEAIAEEVEAEPAAAEEARASTPAPPPAPPPLAAGDSLALGARPTVKVEVPTDAPAKASAKGSDAATPTKKPPPPGAAKAPGAAPKAAGSVRPVKLAAPSKARAPPLGTRPAATGAGPGAAEVLPAPRKTRRGAATAGAVALILVATVGLYVLLANAAPVAVLDVGAGPFQAGEVIGFNANRSSDPNQDPMSFAWEFGDGSTARGSYVQHAYVRSGTYAVNLTVTDTEGLSTRAHQDIPVTPGTIVPPPYRYGDRLNADVSGTSLVEATGQNPPPLGSFKASLPPIESTERTYYIWGVNLSYTGTQERTIGPQSISVADGFLVQQDTYESRRFLDLTLSGVVENDSPRGELMYTGSSDVIQSDFLTIQSNDTVRRTSSQDTTVEIQETDPVTTLQSSARMIEYPDLASAADQLRLESIYAGKEFSTEDTQRGSLRAEGYDWTWDTEGTEIVAGQLAVKLNFTFAGAVPGANFLKLHVTLWLSSASSFPLKEVYYVWSIEAGRTYESLFTSVATGPGTAGSTAIPYADGTGSYPPPAASSFAPLGPTPRGGSLPDFAFGPGEAYAEARADNNDFDQFLQSNPNAYAVNGSYGLNVGNPRWLLDFHQNGSGETMRIDVERAGTTQVRTAPGQDEADLSAADIGSVVSIDYCTALLEDEDQAAALFPGGVLTSLHANFTIRSSLSVPSLSFNAASAATRSDLAYAFGVESRPDETNRVRAYVDAATGQLSFSLWETGDSLP
jgi:hypothetical protein